MATGRISLPIPLCMQVMVRLNHYSLVCGQAPSTYQRQEQECPDSHETVLAATTPLCLHLYCNLNDQYVRNFSHSLSIIMAGDGELAILSSNNDDIIIEILSWLPFVSLLRFRCVCKAWRALITTPQFVAKHRAHTNDNNENVLILTKPSWPPPPWPQPHSVSPLLIYYQSLKKNVDACASASSSAIRSNHRDIEAEIPDDTSLNNSSLVGSCNGLICLLLNPPLEYYEEYYENIRLLLWNLVPEQPVSYRTLIGFVSDHVITDSAMIPPLKTTRSFWAVKVPKMDLLQSSHSKRVHGRLL
nr:uncharacterized protein LOC103421309 [Malus domestica]